MFFQFLKENPSKVLLVLDGVDEADPKKLEMYLNRIQKKQLPGCYIVLTSRHEANSKVRPYTDTLLEIVRFISDDAKCFIRKYFQHAEHLAEKLFSEVYRPSYFPFQMRRTIYVRFCILRTFLSCPQRNNDQMIKFCVV